MFHAFRPYVRVADRKRHAEREMEKLRKKGVSVEPVVVSERTIARTFWGKAWCDNLERYSDYANRLPRGRTYVRSGSVVDLQIFPGEVRAHVSGTEIYRIRISITPLESARWRALCADCAGGIDSLVELLQGRFSGGVMERICRAGTGLFPSPKEIELDCSCPDWASMCKHVAAALYGVGARLDERPELLFRLRQVDESELIAHAGNAVPLTGQDAAEGRILGGEDLSALFGIDLAAVAPPRPGQATAENGGRKNAAAPRRARAIDLTPSSTKPSAAAQAKRSRKPPETPVPSANVSRSARTRAARPERDATRAPRADLLRAASEAVLALLGDLGGPRTPRASGARASQKASERARKRRRA